MGHSVAVTLLHWLGSAWAASVGFAASDGAESLGVVAPGWTAWAAPVPASSDFEALSRDLERAWEERRQLDNEAARARAVRVVASLRPTLDVAQRELLQRALFLLGVLELDAAGDFDRLAAPVIVGELRVPAPWFEAFSVAPGAPAPPTGDVAYAAQVYEQARTVAVQTGGVAFDPTADGAVDVRVDGERVVGEVTLLPGQHTLSWHEPGAEPRALVVAVGAGEGLPLGVLEARVQGLRAALSTGRVAGPEREALRAAVGSPAVELSVGVQRRVAWLVDGPARWGQARLAGGVEAGGLGLFGGGAPTPAGCEGDLDGPQKVLLPVAAVAVLSVGPWRLRGGAGATWGLSAESSFATAEARDCGGYEQPGPVDVLWGGWGSLGYRYRVAGTQSEVFLRLGGNTVLASAEVGVAARVFARGPAAAEVLLRAGAAANTWSGEGNRVAGTAGLGLVLLLGQP